MQDLNTFLRKVKYQARQRKLDEAQIRREEADRLLDIRIKKQDEATQYYNEYKLARGAAVTASLDSSFRSEVELFALSSVIALQKLCIRAYPKQLTIHNFNVSSKFDWSLRRTRSKGGNYKGPHISIAMLRSIMILPFQEYSHIDSDPEIGGINASTWQDRLLVVLAHEVAHAAARKMWHYEKREAHGVKWQGVYRLLRCSYVNSRNGAFNSLKRVVKQKAYGKISLNELLLHSKLVAA